MLELNFLIRHGNQYKHTENQIYLLRFDILETKYKRYGVVPGPALLEGFLVTGMVQE